MANFIRAGKQYHEAVQGTYGNPSLLKKRLQHIKSLNNSVLERISNCTSFILSDDETALYQKKVEKPNEFEFPETMYALTPFESLFKD